MPQKVFALSTASSIAPSGGIGSSAGTASGWSISTSATRMMLRSSGWIRCTDQPCAWRSITSSSSCARSAAACASARANSDASASSVSASGRPVRSCW